ncbi:MAG: TetR family transcriptional regulator [Shinella sp.]|nr:MAG: TetR family transcriptional regulator [Shinella sp.]
METISAAPARRTSIGAQRNPDSEEAILAAAESILIEEGFAAFSIEAVARRAKAGKPTIYRWWPSKAALLLDVYHRQKQDMSVADSGNVRKDLALFLKGLLSFWRGNGGAIFRSVIAEAQSDPATLEALRNYLLDRWRQMGAILQRAQERGEIKRDIDPELLIEVLSGFAWTRLLTGRLDCSDAEIDAVVDAVVSGIATR